MLPAVLLRALQGMLVLTLTQFATLAHSFRMDFRKDDSEVSVLVEVPGPMPNFPHGSEHDPKATDGQSVRPGQPVIGEAGILEWMERLRGQLSGNVEIEEVGSAIVNGRPGWLIGDGHHRFCAAMRLGRSVKFVNARRIQHIEVSYAESLFPATGVHWKSVRVVDRLVGSVFDQEQRVHNKSTLPPPKGKANNNRRPRLAEARRAQGSQDRAHKDIGRTTLTAPGVDRSKDQANVVESPRVGDSPDVLDYLERGLYDPLDSMELGYGTGQGV